MADAAADGIAAVQISSPPAAKAGVGAAVAPPALLYLRPHDGFAAGCPSPPCHEERIATAQGIHQAMALKDGELESTLRLLCKVFDVETATVSLLTGERIFLIGACGALPVTICPDRWGFCGWSFLNSTHELNVVEDMEADTRFSENLFVVSESFHLKFYTMAPLISSNGHRVGTLCIMGQQKRRFDATRGAILANLSELLVRQIERRWVQHGKRQDGSRLLRSADAYTSAVAFVDAADTSNVRLLHLNAPARELLGVDLAASYDELPRLSEGRHRAPFDGLPLSSLLAVDLSAAAWRGLQAAELVIDNVEGAAGTPLEGKHFSVTFRLAAAEVLDEHAPFSVGVPSWLRESDDEAPKRNFFFMHVRPAAPGGGGGGASPLQDSGLACVPRGVLAMHTNPIANLVLGPLLGRGAYGRVLRGVHEGKEVAVKIIDRLSTVRVNKAGVPIEVSLTSNLHHLGVLRSFAWGIGQPNPSCISSLQQQGAEAPQPTCWIVTELCDKHTFVDGVVKGWFRTSRLPTQGGTALRTVALTAYEIASAMAYIHQHNTLHLDLSGGNVLLTSCGANPHGFAAKVADFGLARNMDIRVRTAPGSYGTVTHMAPEMITAGLLSAKCDVWAFGVLLWEALTGSRAWAGMTHAEVLAAVGSGRQQLWVPPGLPPVLHELLVGCLARQPEDRPTFKQMLPSLETCLQATRGTQPELPLHSAAARDY